MEKLQFLSSEYFNLVIYIIRKTSSTPQKTFNITRQEINVEVLIEAYFIK